MRSRTRRRRVAWVVLGAAALLATAQLLAYEPRPLPVLLLGALGGAGALLLADVASPVPPRWYPPAGSASTPRGRDSATQSHLRHLENHQGTPTPDAVVRDRLRDVADRVLQARHGVRVDSEQGRTRLGPELVTVLDGPVVRMKPRRIDQVLRMIEEL